MNIAFAIVVELADFLRITNSKITILDQLYFTDNYSELTDS